MGTHISDGLFGLFFCISRFLDRIIYLTLNLDKVSFQLLLGVDKTGVLNVYKVVLARYLERIVDIVASCGEN